MTSTFIPGGAERYDAHMGRWSRRLAPLFLDFVGVGRGERVLDVGCGTGNLAFEIAKNKDIADIEAVDFEEHFIEALRHRNTDPRIKAQQGDACALPYPNGYFDRTLSMLVLHFVSDAEKAAAEMCRVLRPGGVGGACVWDSYGGMPAMRLFWDTVAAFEPAANERRANMLLRPMTQAEELKDAFVKAGFVDITETLLTIRMDFASFDDYWLPLMTSQGNPEQYLANLPERISAQVRWAVQEGYLCNKPDGPRSFAGVAWSVRGVVRT